MGKLSGFARSRIIVFFLCCLPAAVLAKSHIYVTNNSGHELVVTAIQVGGDPISKKAWKKGQSALAEEQRVRVLTVNRTGKVNWMDPTPRFVEPGKTTTFIAHINTPDQEENALQLKLRLLGTGKSSKMWYSTDGLSDNPEWSQALTSGQGRWTSVSGQSFQVGWRAFDQDGKTHLEYVIEAAR